MKSQNRSFSPCRSIPAGSYLAVFGSHLFTNVSLSTKKLFILIDLLSSFSVSMTLEANKTFSVNKEPIFNMY